MFQKLARSAAPVLLLALTLTVTRAAPNSFGPLLPDLEQRVGSPLAYLPTWVLLGACVGFLLWLALGSAGVPVRRAQPLLMGALTAATAVTAVLMAHRAWLFALATAIGALMLAGEFALVGTAEHLPRPADRMRLLARVGAAVDFAHPIVLAGVIACGSFTGMLLLAAAAGLCGVGFLIRPPLRDAPAPPRARPTTLKAALGVPLQPLRNRRMRRALWGSVATWIALAPFFPQFGHMVTDDGFGRPLIAAGALVGFFTAPLCWYWESLLGSRRWLELVVAYVPVVLPWIAVLVVTCGQPPVWLRAALWVLAAACVTFAFFATSQVARRILMGSEEEAPPAVGELSVRGAMQACPQAAVALLVVPTAATIAARHGIATVAGVCGIVGLMAAALHAIARLPVSGSTPALRHMPVPPTPG